MCTLSWWDDGQGGYEVFFNRDESKDREIALPPREAKRRGVKILAPVDPRAGGTWISVNESGAALALLNWYEEAKGPIPSEGWRSRGQLVLDLADVKDLASLENRIETIEGALYPPFYLISFFPAPRSEGRLEVAGWKRAEDGTLHFISDLAPPISSSSFQTVDVIASREARFRELVSECGRADPDILERYHRGTEKNGKRVSEIDAYSVPMNRSDAQTWSISRIQVDAEQIRFRYLAQAPDLLGEGEEFEGRLARPVKVR